MEVLKTEKAKSQVHELQVAHVDVHSSYFSYGQLCGAYLIQKLPDII